MPGRSRYGSPPTAPPYGIKPFVVTKPTMPLRQAGCLQDPPVSSQMEQVTRFALTDAAEPELEPPVSRAVSYGLHAVPPHVLRSPAPNSWLVTFPPPGFPPPPLYSERFAFA